MVGGERECIGYWRCKALWDCVTNTSKLSLRPFRSSFETTCSSSCVDKNLIIKPSLLLLALTVVCEYILNLRWEDAVSMKGNRLGGINVYVSVLHLIHCFVAFFHVQALILIFGRNSARRNLRGREKRCLHWNFANDGKPLKSAYSDKKETHSAVASG